MPPMRSRSGFLQHGSNFRDDKIARVEAQQRFHPGPAQQLVH